MRADRRTTARRRQELRLEDGGRKQQRAGSFGVSALGRANGTTGARDRGFGHDGERVGRGASGAQRERERGSGEKLRIRRLGRADDAQRGNLVSLLGRLHRRLRLLGVRALAFDGVVERDDEVVRVRGRVRRDLALDASREDMVDQRLLEGLHLEEAALGDGVGDLLGALLADQVGDARVRHHHLDRSDAAAAETRQQPLADDAAEDAGEDGADLLLLAGREELDHPADGLGCVDRVQRREDEMAGLGGLERGLRRLRVAQLADQDRVRVLAEHAA